MQKIFMSVLRLLNLHGDVTAASLYKNGTWSTLTVKTNDGEYEVTITKKEGVKEDAN